MGVMGGESPQDSKGLGGCRVAEVQRWRILTDDMGTGRLYMNSHGDREQIWVKVKDKTSSCLFLFSGSFRTEPGTGNWTFLEPELAEPDTQPEPLERNWKKCFCLVLSPKSEK